MGTIGALFDAFVSGMEDEAQRILVIIGATPEGEKELLGFDNGAGESAHRLALPAA
jgi:transposase-like protein